MSVNIQLEWTPNPSTLKYVVDRTLIPRGALNFTTPEAASARSPLAFKLMGIEGVSGVMLGSNFVTVTKGESGEWDSLNDAVMATLDAHLGANEPVVAPGSAGEEVGVPASGSEVEDRIRRNPRPRDSSGGDAGRRGHHPGPVRERGGLPPHARVVLRMSFLDDDPEDGHREPPSRGGSRGGRGRSGLVVRDVAGLRS